MTDQRTDDQFDPFDLFEPCPKCGLVQYEYPPICHQEECPLRKTKGAGENR